MQCTAINPEPPVTSTKFSLFEFVFIFFCLMNQSSLYRRLRVLFKRRNMLCLKGAVHGNFVPWKVKSAGEN
jgi:hypothetical protein